METYLIVILIILIVLVWIQSAQTVENMGGTPSDAYSMGDVAKSYKDGVLNVGTLNVTSSLNILPPKTIVMWYGTVSNIPAGWALCDGVSTLNDGTKTPNLIGKFIKGRADDGIPSTVAGTPPTVSGPKAINLVTSVTGGVHTHSAPTYILNSPVTTINFVHSGCSSFAGIKHSSAIKSSTIATIGGSHTHSITINQVTDLKPNHYQLIFIMRK